MISNNIIFYVIIGILLIGFFFVGYVFLIKPMLKRLRSKKNIEPAKKFLKRLDEKYPPDKITPDQSAKRSKKIIDSGFGKYTIGRAQLLNHITIKKLNLKKGVTNGKEKTVEEQDGKNLEEEKDRSKRTGTTRINRRTEETNRDRIRRNKHLTKQRVFPPSSSKRVGKNKRKSEWDWKGFK